MIAVALFAALSYALIEGSRGSGSMMSSEQARIYATEIVQYGDSLRPIVDKMLLLNGISDTNSPAGTGILFDYPASAETAPLSRELFDPTGGNAPYMTPSPEACLSACAYTFSGQYTFTGIGSGANPDLAMLLVNIPQQVCEMVNSVLGLGTGIPTGPVLSGTGTQFNGTNYGASGVSLSTSYHALCYQESGGGNRYIYVNVIRAR